MIYAGSLISLVPGGLAFTSVQLLGENNTLAMINGSIKVILLAVSLTLGVGLSSIITGGIPKLKNKKNIDRYIIKISGNKNLLITHK